MMMRLFRLFAIIITLVLLLFTMIGNTPSFTQGHYNNDFYNYAEKSSTLELQKAEVRISSNYITNVIGTVFEQNTNQPVSDVKISVKSVINDKEIANISSDQRGRFHIIGLPDGHYNWFLENPKYKNSSYLNYEVYAGEGTVIFTFYIAKDKELVQERYNKFGE